MRREWRIVVLGFAAIALHVIVDSFVLPQPGTSAGDHLVSGLVPIAVLVFMAAIYPRLRAGSRAATAMTVGAIGILVGGPSAYYILKSSAEGNHFTGPLAIAGGVVMLATGPVTAWKARRTGGNRRRRYLHRSLGAATVALVTPVIFFYAVFPIGFSYIYTHTGPTPSTPDLGVPNEAVTVTTSDSLDLNGWYVPSKNRAAVIVFPGPPRAEEGRMLVAHGYGVLLLEPRGQGHSDGDSVRWAGATDLLAGIEYLKGRPDVDRDRIGGFGFSVGGESLIEAAAQSTGFNAVVSEGAGERVGEADVSGLARLLVAPMQAVMTAATTTFANQGPPPSIVDRIDRIAPRPVFLIYADPGMCGESIRQPKYYEAAGQPKTMWLVPGATHTGGIDAQPTEYEQRVVEFFDDALLGGQ
ncbi:alpha/beta hydrolase [Aeromicrobium sp.]